MAGPGTERRRAEGREEHRTDRDRKNQNRRDQKEQNPSKEQNRRADADADAGAGAVADGADLGVDSFPGWDAVRHYDSDERKRPGQTHHRRAGTSRDEDEHTERRPSEGRSEDSLHRRERHRERFCRVWMKAGEDQKEQTEEQNRMDSLKHRRKMRRKRRRRMEQKE